MSRVKRIENISDKDVQVNLTGGGSVTLPPKATLENVDVDSVNEQQVKIKEDLTEVNNISGKTRIYG